jgi:hypothetical protein
MAMRTRLEMLQSGIQQRQQELHNIAAILARSAKKKGLLAASAKVLTIVLGAFAATNAVSAKLFDQHRVQVSIIYTFIGLAITAISGLEAAFRTGSTASELKVLAAQCQATIFQIDTKWLKSVAGMPEQDQLAAALDLLEQQDAMLAQTQTKAAELGINIAQEIRELYVDSPPAMA